MKNEELFDEDVEMIVIEEAAENHHNTFRRDSSFAETRMKSFIEGVKWHSKRSYTLEQISELFIGENGGYFDDYLDFKLNLKGENPNQLKPSFKEWFKQFKKK